MPKEKVGEYLPPELRSRFSYKCAFWKLSEEEKNAYVKFKSEQLLDKIKAECANIDKDLSAESIIKVDTKKYENLRDINSEIMRQLTEELYEKIVE